MVLAILFYVGLGIFIFYAVWGPKDQKPGTHQTTTTLHPAHHSYAAPAKDGTRVPVAGEVFGLLGIPPA